MGAHDGQKTSEDKGYGAHPSYDGQMSSMDVGKPVIPRVPPGYPSTAKAKAAMNDGFVKDGGSPTAGEQRTGYSYGS